MMDYETQESNGMAGVMFFALGAATGAALACLFAPASGRETREYLFNGARQAGDQAAAAAARARDLASQGRDAAVQAVDDFRSKMDNTIAFGRDTIEKGKENVRRAVEEGRDAYQRARAEEPTTNATQA